MSLGQTGERPPPVTSAPSRRGRPCSLRQPAADSSAFAIVWLGCVRDALGFSLHLVTSCLPPSHSAFLNFQTPQKNGSRYCSMYK